MPKRVNTDPFEYVQSLYIVTYKELSGKISFGVPCDENVTGISAATLDWAGLNRGTNGTYNDTGLDTDYWIAICPPYQSLTYNGYGSSTM